MGRLDGKVCVITGAGGGMGREAALLFTSEGARVCVADVMPDTAEETVALCPEGSAFSARVDVADEDAVEEMMAATAERFGGIDVLYNNAGISPADDSSILDTSVEAWNRVLAVNATGVFLCCKHGIPRLLERRRIHWPTGRLATPREIVNAALFLASDESSFVNGATFVVDGALTAAYVTPE